MTLDKTKLGVAAYLDTPEHQAAYLELWLADSSPAAIEAAIATVARARKMEAPPVGDNLPAAIRALGFRLSVKPA